MRNLIFRALPVTAVILDVLLIYSLGKELVEDIQKHRKTHSSTTTKEESPTPDTVNEPVTT